MLWFRACTLFRVVTRSVSAEHSVGLTELAFGCAVERL